MELAHIHVKRTELYLLSIFLLYLSAISPAEIKDDLAIASIENVFVYSDRYGHSDLKSD